MGRIVDGIRYYLPGIVIWLVGLSIFLGIFLQVFGAGVGPPFYWAYYGFLVLFILTLFVPAVASRRKGTSRDRSGSGRR